MSLTPEQQKKQEEYVASVRRARANQRPQTLEEAMAQAYEGQKAKEKEFRQREEELRKQGCPEEINQKILRGG